MTLATALELSRDRRPAASRALFEAVLDRNSGRKVWEICLLELVTIRLSEVDTFLDELDSWPLSDDVTFSLVRAVQARCCFALENRMPALRDESAVMTLACIHYCLHSVWEGPWTPSEMRAFLQDVQFEEVSGPFESGEEFEAYRLDLLAKLRELLPSSPG